MTFDLRIHGGFLHLAWSGEAIKQGDSVAARGAYRKVSVGALLYRQ